MHTYIHTYIHTYMQTHIHTYMHTHITCIHYITLHCITLRYTTLNDITLHSASLESYASIFKILQKIKPEEVYHLAAQSYVAYSFEDEFSTFNTNISGTHYVLSAVKEFSDKLKFYFAGSSEMFGKTEEIPQNEKTKFHPRSIYGISKLAAYEITRNYREAYNMFACSGIMFNHESPRRGYEFVTRKISIGVAKIKLGLEKKISLGNINARRDWGYALDYVEVMHKMLQNDTPDDFVIGLSLIHISEPTRPERIW